MDDTRQIAIQSALTALSQGQIESAKAILTGLAKVDETVHEMAEVQDQHGEILTRIFATVASKGDDNGDSLTRLLATLIKQIENQMVRMAELSKQVIVRLDDLPERLAQEMHRQSIRIPAE
jgi:hypothetical protein